MKTKLRKLLALLMTLAMFISSVPTTALAAVVPYPGGTDTGSGISLRSIVKPPVATTTYVFMNGTEEFARQILKNGETLNNPGTPTADSANKEFVGWFDESGNQLTFPITASVGSASSTVTVNARFADVYFVFFTNEKGEVMVTKKGANGDKISTEDVTYPVDNEQSIVGWKDASGNLVSSVTLNGRDVTLTAKVENGHWITYDSQGGTYVAPAFVKGNGTTTAPAAPTRPGYTFRHWSATVGGAAFNFGNALTTALTLYAVWTPNTRTQYTVIHWQENADDDEYSYAESETKYGTTGAQTSAAAKSYTGFTAQTIAQQTIAGDGSTIVSVYYKRNVYEVKFYSNSSWYSSSEEYTSLRITAKYGANISNRWPTYNGSNTWSTTDGGTTYQVNIDTMPLNGAKFYGPKTGSSSESAHYYVEVLPGETGVTVSGVTYKLHHTDTSPGTGYTVSVEDQYPITGFTFNSAPSTSTGGRYNNAKFYYTRNSYNIVYVSGGQTVNTVSKKFEESIADAGSYTPTVKPAGMEDYDFGGWHADPAGEQAYTFTGKTMPAQNVTVYAKWNKPVYNGTIYLTIEGTTGSSITLNVPKGDTIETALNDKQAEIMAQVGEGYTWRGWRTGKDGTGEPFNPQTRITTDVTLYPYYTKDGTFTVEYVSGKNDVTAPVDGKSYAEDSFADLKSPGKLVADDGEYFLGWSDGAATYQPRDKYQIKSNHANERNVITLTAQWGARPAGTTLTYKANGGAGEDVVENLANNATVTTKPADTFSRVGYTFKGWDTNPKGEGSIAPNTQVQVDNNDGANVLYAIWTANTNTKYTVEFYYQNTDGSYPQKANESVVRNDGTTDTTVSVKDSDKLPQDGGKYVFDESNANNVLSGVVAGDGSLVLKLYFKLNTASYTIHHYLNGTTVKVANDQTGAKTIGEELTANKSDALYAAYAAAEVASYAPSQTITIAADESENVITVYYTMPLTIKAKDASKTYDGQPLTQPDFTVEGLVNGDTKENFSLSMTAASTITNAGSTPNEIDESTVKYNGDAIPSYYNVSYNPGTLTVNPVTAAVIVTVTENGAIVTYDGTEHSVKGYKSMTADNELYDVTTSVKATETAAWTAKGTNAGEYPVGIAAGDFENTNPNFENVAFVIEDGVLKINPITDEVIVTVTENGATVTYDGNEHSVKGYKSMTADNELYDVTTSVKATETAAWTAKGTNAGEYPVGIAAGDFENTNKNFTNVTFNIVDDVLKINPITENTITITANSASKTYDGTPLTDNGFTFTEGVLVKGDVLTAVVEGSATNVGDEGVNKVMSYKVTRNGEDVTKNYTFTDSVDGSLTINKRTVTLTSETASKEYDGTPLTKPVVTVSGDGFVAGEVTDVKATGSVTFVHEGEVTNAITYTKGASFKETNYTISKDEGKLSITKREGEGKTITVTANSDGKVYDGAPLTNNGFNHAGALVEGDVLTAVVVGSQTDVGVGDNVVTSYKVMRGETDVTTSYTFTESVKGALTVTARGVTFTGESKSLPYTGGMQRITGITQSGLVEGHRYEGLTYKAEGQNVGSYDGAFSGDVVIKDAQGNDVTKNYKVTKEPGKLTITNASFTVTFTGESDTKVYNGSEQSITGITVDGLKTGHRYEGLIYEAKGTNKGEYVGAFTGTVKILDENNVDVTENYAITQTPGKLTITAVETEVVVRITGHKDTVTYDGAEHTVTGYDVSISNELYKEADFTFTGSAEVKGTGANTYPMGLKVSDFRNDSKNFTNVKFVVTDGELVISKRPVMVYAETLEYAYDYANPAAHPADDVARYTVEAANGDRGLLTGDALNADVLYDGQSTQTLIGVYQAVAQIAAAKITNANGDVTANYTIEKVDSTLTIKGNDPIDPGKETTSVHTNYTVGDVIEYKITVKNVSRDEATNVVVTDSMAEIQDSVGYTVSEDRHTATIASIPAGGTVLVYARHTVTAEDVENAYAGDASGSLTNVANIKFGDWNKDVEGDHDELNDTYEYVVRYYWNNYTSVQPHEEKKLTARVGTEVTEKPAAIEGYTPVSADSRKLTISADQSKNVIEFYYYKNVELTANSETYTYDGAEKQVNGFTIKGENKDQDDQTIAADFSAITVGAKGVDAGEYPANFAENTVGAVDKTGRYIVTAANNGKLVINPVTGQLITITANSASKIYDGTPLTDNGFDYTKGVLADGDVLTAVVEGSATNVGDEGRNVVKSYAVKRDGVDVTKNYTFGNSNDGKLTINPRSVTLKSETASKEYDGTPLTKPDVTVTGDGFVASEVSDIKATGSATFVDDGEVTNAITFTTGEKFNEKNYTITKDEGKLSITKRTDIIVITTPTRSRAYNGRKLLDYSCTHTGTIADGDVLIMTFPEDAGLINAGSKPNQYERYRVERKSDGRDVTNNYTFGESIIGTLTVTPVAIELTAGSASKAYDGTPLTNSNYTITKGAFVGEEGLAAVTIAGSQTLVGTSANTITGHTLKDNTLAQNYTITYQPGELKVTQNEKAITVTANSHTWEYDGQPHSDGGYTVEYDGQTYKVEAGKTATLPTGDVVKAKITKTVTNVSDSAANNNQIDELTIVNAAGEDTKGQYKTVTLIPGTLTITKRGAGEDKVKITAADNTVEYDGRPHGAKLNAAGQIELGTSYTVTNLAEGHSVKTLAIEGSETDAGVYADKLVPGNAVIVDGNGVEVTANYDITYVPGALTITRRGAGDDKVVLTAADNTVVYDGQPHGAKLNAAGEIEVGTSYTITNLADGHKVQSVVISGSETAVGEYENRLVPSGAKIVDAEGNDVTRNYVVGYKNGKLTITSPDTVIVTIRGNKDTVEYDGQKHEVNGYEVVSISNTLYTEADFGFADGARAHAEGTDAGDYFMNLTKDSFVNRNGNFSAVTFVVEDGQLTITKRGLDKEKLVKITAADNSVYYDGQPHGAKLNAAGQIEVGTSYTTEYLAPGHKVQAVAIDGSETMVGVYENRLVPKTAIIVDENDNDVTRNYVITYVPGTLEIRKNETEIKVTANSHTWEYDGQPHTDGGYTVNYDGVDYPVAAGEFATLPTGDKVTATVEGSVTNVADSADDNNVVTNVTITNEAGTVVNDQYKTITRVNGGLKITRRGDSEDEDKKVKIIAEPNTVEYDGSAHGAKLNAAGEIELGTSYTTTRLVEGHYVDETTLDITGSQTNVGVYENELNPAVKAGKTEIVIRDAKGNDVTANYELTLVPNTLTITGDKLIPDKKAEDEDIESNYKLGDEIEFTITVKNVSIYEVENVEVVDRNAEIQAGDGYTVSADKHTATIASIAAKSEIRIKALHTVTSEDILAGKVGNVANVEWKDGEKTVTKTVDDDTTKLTPPDVTLNVTKTSDWEGKATGAKLELGTKITYTITVKNTGNVPYTNVNFTDLLQNGDATVTGEIPTYGTLAVNEEKSFTVEYIVTEADLLKESINNKVTAEADEIEYTYYEGETEKTGKATPKGDAQVTDNTDAASASFTSTKTTTSTPKNEKGYELGETITYEIKVTNDGNLTLTDVEVTEKLAGAVIKASSDYTVSGSVATIAELKPGQTVIVNVEYVVTEADILAGSVKNVATVKGNGPDDKDPDPKDPGTDDPTDKPKATLDIAKSVVSTPKNGTSYKLGEKITYKLTVKVGADNNVTVKNVRVTDTLLTAENVNAKIVEIAGGYTLNETGEIELPDMAPGAADVVITYTYTVQESDLGSGAYGSVHNAAVSKGATPDPDPENPNPKPDDPKDEDDNDTPTNIRLIITAKDNPGIEYDGDAHGENGYDATGLATGHEITSVTISGSRTNVGYYTDELEPSDAVIKEGNEDVTSHYEITYVPGDLEIIQRGLDEKNPVQIIAKPNTVGYDGKAHGAKLNAKGEIELGTSYTTARLVDGHYVDETTLDITGSQTNVGVYEEELKPAVKAGATRIVIRDKDGNDVTDNYALTLVNATLTITGDKLIPDKKAEDENIESNYKLGDKIEFTITVKNVSIYDVENVIVTDANAEIQAGDGYTVSADKHTATIAIIAAKSEIRIKALHTVTSEDILAGKVGNVANVEWKDGEKTVTKTVDDDTTKLTPPDVTLNVTKTSDWEGKATGAKLELGTKITYTITVKNTGNVPYTNVNFTDLLQNGDATVTGEIPTYGTLAVNEEKSFTVEYIVTEADLLKESINNKVTAEADEIEYTYYEGETEKTGKATPKGDAQVTDNTDAASASFTSTKTTTSTPKNEKGYELGETITYEIKVTNDGNLTLTDVEVTEKLAGAVIKASSDYTVSGSVATIAELKPGQTVIVNVEYVVTEADILAGSVKNVATVKGNGPDDKDPDPKDPGTDDPTDKPKATLDIAKSVVSTPKNGTSYKLGEKITYKLTVKVGADNNVTVKNVRVTDTLLTAENVNAKIVEIAGGYTLNETGEIELPDMAPGAADVVITYTYTVQESDLGSGAYGSVHNAAVSKGATPDPDPENPNPKPVDPKDEDKKDTPTNIRLVITANNNTGIVYDGEEHGEDGYKQTGLSKDHTIEKVTISGKRTNVGEEKLVPSDAKIVDKAGNDVTSHYDIEYVNATLEIIQKKLTITADSDEKFYDETPLTKDSYTNTELAKGDEIANVTITGTITEVGSVENVASGAKIVNAAEEDVTGNYDIEYVKGTLTIKAIPSDGFVDVTITKKWDDANNQDGKRDDVTLTLNASANGRLIDWDVLKDIAKNGANLTMDETAEHVFARAEFTDDKDSYSYTFRNVPKYANFNDVNTLIDFAVTENEVPDFYEIDAESSTRLMIVNVHEVKTMNIHVTKVWEDENNNDGYRPDAITVKLYADGALYGEKTITPDENDVWETLFEDLPVYKKGETISYTVEEDAIDEYTTTYSTEKPIVGGDYDEAAREVTITNRYEIKKMNIKVIKIWADAGNTDKLRPSELTFNLYKTVGDGEKELVQEFRLKSSNGNSVWKHKDLRTTLEGLNVYENGEKVHYSIEETTKLEGYTVKYIDNDIVGGNKVNDQYQTDFMTWVTNYHIIKRPNRLIGPMGMTSGECVE